MKNTQEIGCLQAECKVAKKECLASKRLIQDTLLALGIAPHYKGFACLEKSLALLLADEEYLSHICTRLYPDVAEILKSKGSRVERCIRHSIGEAAWKTDLWKMLFQHAPKNPSVTNSYFLGRVLLYLKNSLEDGQMVETPEESETKEAL